MKAKDLYYRNQGGAPLGGVITALIVGLIAAIILGGLYTVAVWFVPLIYINILFAVALGVLLGKSVGLGAIKGKVRSVGPVLLIALIAALVAEYVQWATYLTLFAHAGDSTSFGSGSSRIDLVSTSFSASVFLYWLGHPGDMITMAQAIAQEGVWSIKNHVPTGVELYAVWGIEALIIIGFTLGFAREQINKPYSESADCWMGKQVMPAALPYIEQPKEFIGQLEAGNYDVILNSETIPDDAKASRAKLTIYSCPEDSYAYLSITNFKAVKKKVKSAHILKYFKLEKSAALRLAQHVGGSIA